MRTVFGKQTHQILDRLELVFARDSEQVVDPEQHSLGDIVARALRQGVNFALVVLSVAPHGHEETIDKTSVHRVIRREQLRLERFRRRVSDLANFSHRGLSAAPYVLLVDLAAAPRVTACRLVS